MKITLIFAIASLLVTSCKTVDRSQEINIIFLHHSTGKVIWQGNTSTVFVKAAYKINNDKLASFFRLKPQLPQLIDKYNKLNNTSYYIEEKAFPKEVPYGWNNYPYDYYNIWVKNAGDSLFMKEPTLEILTEKYQVVIFKHCFPVSNIQTDLDTADINSEYKTLANYKLQYLALRDKLHEFPGTKFILFTGAALVQSSIREDEASRAREFFKWVIEEWDTPDDNIYLWDLFQLQTEGGLYFKDEYAVSPHDSHPNEYYAGKLSKLLANRIVDVIEADGKRTTLTGETIH